MRGYVIHYSPEHQQGIVRGEDGRRYGFHHQYWRGQHLPNAGDDVDFEVHEGTVAYDIYVLKPAAQPIMGAQVDLGKIRSSVTQGAKDFSGSGLGQRVLGDWTMILAAITLIGSWLPFLSIGGETASVFGVGREIGQAVDGLKQLDALSSQFGSRSGQQASGLAGVIWSMRLVYLLYIIPIFAVAVLVYGVLGRSTARVGFWNGLTAAVLPFAVPSLVMVAIWAQLPPELRSGGPSGFDISFMGLGFWVMVAAGVAQILNRLGWIKKSPADLTQST